jgi:hypothetical protein|tara:strand:+ start:1069 stop:1332 length:264 start_codon:yes stop_codon:yes gene_type:complete
MPHGIKRKSIRDPKSDVERQPSRIPELEQLMVEMTEEAISVKLDYEQNVSEMDSGSMVVIHQNSSLLDNDEEELSDIAVNIKRKEDE